MGANLATEEEVVQLHGMAVEIDEQGQPAGDTRRRRYWGGKGLQLPQQRLQWLRPVVSYVMLCGPFALSCNITNVAERGRRVWARPATTFAAQISGWRSGSGAPHCRFGSTPANEQR